MVSARVGMCTRSWVAWRGGTEQWSGEKLFTEETPEAWETSRIYIYIVGEDRPGKGVCPGLQT